MPNNLSDIEVDEISFVRKGANQGAKVLLWKSDSGAERGGELLTTTDLDDAAEATVESRKWVEELARRDAAHSGLSFEQCVARIYEQHEWAYAAENMASETVSQVQSQVRSGVHHLRWSKAHGQS